MLWDDAAWWGRDALEAQEHGHAHRRVNNIDARLPRQRLN
jgi:hypothetical protein